MSQSVLYDQLGPRGRRRAAIGTAATVGVLGWLLYVAIRRFADNGQLAGDKWEIFTRGAIIKFIAEGLWVTLKVAAIAMVLATSLGALLALGRLARTRAIRWAATTYVEIFRSLPLLLLILFSARYLPRQGLRFDLFWYLVIGLVLYNSAVFAEIFRAGIRSLDRGQTEAAYAVGLSHWGSMRFVVLPQAIRRMVPSLVSQLITLLKDTTLGVILPVEELLHRGEIIGQQPEGAELQAFIVIAGVFVAVNFTLSRIARRLELRQRRRLGAGAVGGVTDDLAVLSAVADADLAR